jgi:hypothetical protein
LKLEDRAFTESIGLSLERTLIRTPQQSEGRSPIVATAILDPLSAEAQLAAPLLKVLRDELNIPVVVVLIPNVDITELPLRNFFRFVFSPSFETESITAQFSKLPLQHLLTLKISTPGLNSHPTT